METDKIMLHRRTVLSSILGAGFGTVLAAPARADVPQYPQLIDPAIKVLHPTRTYFVGGTTAGSRVFAVGEEGVIVYSDDAGQSWTQAAVPVSVTLTDIVFASPQIGWAVGAFGVILKTEDAGKTWVKQLDGIAEIALMNTATQAFVAAQPPAPQAPPSNAADGTPPPASAADHAARRAQILTGQGPDKAYLSLLVVSETEAFAFGAYRFADHTTDGGKSWTDCSLDIGDLSKASPNIYGAAIIDNAYYLVSETSLIFRSTDGGQTFPQLAQPGGPGGATFFGICDTGTGGILAYGVAGEMYLSTDQGKTWNAPQFTGTSNINSVISLLNGALLIAGDAGGGLWMSRDHGSSFTLMTRNPIMGINALVPMGGLKFLILSGIGAFPVDLSKMHAS